MNALKERLGPIFILVLLSFAIFQTVATIGIVDNPLTKDALLVLNFGGVRGGEVMEWRGVGVIQNLSNVVSLRGLGLMVLPALFFSVFKDLPERTKGALAFVTAAVFGCLTGIYSGSALLATLVTSVATMYFFGLQLRSFGIAMVFGTGVGLVLGYEILRAIVAASIFVLLALTPMIVAHSARFLSSRSGRGEARHGV